MDLHARIADLPGLKQHTDDSAVYFREEYDSSLRKSEVISSTKTYVDDGLKTIVTTVQDISAAVLDAINAKCVEVCGLSAVVAVAKREAQMYAVEAGRASLRGHTPSQRFTTVGTGPKMRTLDASEKRRLPVPSAGPHTQLRDALRATSERVSLSRPMSGVTSRRSAEVSARPSSGVSGVTVAEDGTPRRSSRAPPPLLSQQQSAYTAALNTAPVTVADGKSGGPVGGSMNKPVVAVHFDQQRHRAPPPVPTGPSVLPTSIDPEPVSNKVVEAVAVDPPAPAVVEPVTATAEPQSSSIPLHAAVVTTVKQPATAAPSDTVTAGQGSAKAPVQHRVAPAVPSAASTLTSDAVKPAPVGADPVTEPVAMKSAVKAPVPDAVKPVTVTAPVTTTTAASTTAPSVPLRKTAVPRPTSTVSSTGPSRALPSPEPTISVPVDTTGVTSTPTPSGAVRPPPMALLAAIRGASPSKLKPVEASSDDSEGIRKSLTASVPSSHSKLKDSDAIPSAHSVGSVKPPEPSGTAVRPPMSALMASIRGASPVTLKKSRGGGGGEGGTHTSPAPAPPPAKPRTMLEEMKARQDARAAAAKK